MIGRYWTQPRSARAVRDASAPVLLTVVKKKREQIQATLLDPGAGDIEFSIQVLDDFGCVNRKVSNEIRVGPVPPILTAKDIGADIAGMSPIGESARWIIGARSDEKIKVCSTLQNKWRLGWAEAAPNMSVLIGDLGCAPASVS
jgi:hypothetical protein